MVSKRVYRVEAVVMPVSPHQRETLEAMAGSLSGLSSLVGLTPQGDAATRLAIATLKGKSFTAAFIRDKGLMAALFPDKWDGRTNRWKGPPPTPLEAVDRLDRHGIRKIIEDRKTGFVTIQINWTDRIQAVDWLNSMVAQVNMELRKAAIAECQRSILFLTTETDRTQSLAVKDAIYRLIEMQMKDLAFAQVQEEYALKFVDRPITPEILDFIWPKRAFLICVGALVGALLAVLVHLRVDASRRAGRDDRA
jgi:hypothetical protein